MLLSSRHIAILFLSLVCRAYGGGVTTATPELAMDSYNNAFYVAESGVGYFKRDTSGAKPSRHDFWRVCEEIALVEDAFESTGKDAYRNMIGELIDGLNDMISKTEDWTSWNHFNDDVMWGVIALARSYKLTGNTEHLSQAETQFNKAWSRGWDKQNGGFWWSTDKKTKNACVHGPAAIAGVLLGELTNGTGFQNQAKQAFQWLRANLYNSSGQVYDHVTKDGVRVDWAFTYNQGTFIGAATLLGHKDDARRAAQWAQTHLTGQHAPNILNDEYNSKEGGGGDGVGFKGVFARWCDMYVKESGDARIGSWLAQNREAAWNNRNLHGVTWAQWWHRTPDSGLTSWECSSAAAIMQTGSADLRSRGHHNSQIDAAALAAAVATTDLQLRI